jgi:hypothetical protein
LFSIVIQEKEIKDIQFGKKEVKSLSADRILYMVNPKVPSERNY